MNKKRVTWLLGHQPNPFFGFVRFSPVLSQYCPGIDKIVVSPFGALWYQTQQQRWVTCQDPTSAKTKKEPTLNNLQTKKQSITTCKLGLFQLYQSHLYAKLTLFFPFFFLFFANKKVHGKLMLSNFTIQIWIQPCWANDNSTEQDAANTMKSKHKPDNQRRVSFPPCLFCCCFILFHLVDLLVQIAGSLIAVCIYQ